MEIMVQEETVGGAAFEIFTQIGYMVSKISIFSKI